MQRAQRGKMSGLLYFGIRYVLNAGRHGVTSARSSRIGTVSPANPRGLVSTTMTAATMTAATTNVEPQPTTGGLSEAVSNIDRRKTKIVCTVGPACSTPEQIRALIEAGANVFRLNFLHADHPWHTAAITTIRAAADKLQVPVAVMQDLCGPKIRLSRVVEENYHVAVGDLIRVTTERHLAADGPAISFDIASTYAALLDDVGPGAVLLDHLKAERQVFADENRVIVDISVVDPTGHWRSPFQYGSRCPSLG